MNAPAKGAFVSCPPLWNGERINVALII
jgi:hypothetical protein